MLVHAYEAEAFEGHGFCIVVEVGVHKLIRWNPLSVTTLALPHIKELHAFITVLLAYGLNL